MLRQLYFFLTKLAVPRVLSERRAKVLKRNTLVASHTDSLLLNNIEINIIRPHLIYTYQHCVIFTYILVYMTENIIQVQLHEERMVLVAEVNINDLF